MHENNIDEIDTWEEIGSMPKTPNLFFVLGSPRPILRHIATSNFMLHKSYFNLLQL